MIETKVVLEKKMRKAGMITNGVLYLGFGGVYFLVAVPIYNYNVDWRITTLTLASFIAAVAVANLAIYRHYKRRMPKGET
jgi:hypothetical protein